MQPINTAVCSFGMSGIVFHAPFIHVNKGFNLYGAWERTKNIAGQKYPGTKTFRTLESMLADPAVELVVVNTPNYTHYEFTRLALEAGKHVIVEKPFTITVAEGAELIKLAKSRGKMLSVYHNRRFDSDFRTVRKIVNEGWLGDIVEAEIHYDRYKMEPGVKIHKEIPGPGTGSLYDLGAHLIDQALQLFGLPESVFGDIGIIRPAISKVDDYFELLLFYPSLRVRLKSSYLVREALPGYAFHGSKGSFIKPKTDVQEALLQAGKIPGGADWGTEPESERGLLHTEKNGAIIREYIPSLRGNYGDYYDGIYRAIREQAPAPVTAEDGLNVIRVIEKAYESHQQKRIVAF